METITIPLDRVRQIRFPMKAVIELEKRFGKTVFNLLSQDFIGYELICSVVYIGLKHGGMKFFGKTVEDNENKVADLIQEHWLDEGKRLEELVQLAFRSLESAGLKESKKDEEEESSNPGEDTDNLEQ